jgi:hypothetical protein
MKHNPVWPVFVKDRKGRNIYLTQERWEHALEHPGMGAEQLKQVLETLQTANRKQDAYDPTKFKYAKMFWDLPMDYTHVVVVVKFGWKTKAPYVANNFVLTAYLVKKRW